MKRVAVHIDSLVLKGFRYEDRHAISAALQEEIARALAAPDAPRRLTELGGVTSLRIGNVSVGVNANPREVGAATGKTIGRGLLK